MMIDLIIMRCSRLALFCFSCFTIVLFIAKYVFRQ